MVITISTGVAEAVSRLLRESGTSQAGLSEQAGIPRTTLQRRLIDGDFTITELARIALVLDTTPDAIIVQGADILAGAA